MKEISLIGFGMIDQTIGDRGIDCLEHRMDDNDTVDFCGCCDILHNEIRSLLAK